MDETLDSPFSFKHFSRSVKYIKRHAKELVSALIFSVIAIVSGLTFPYILMIITDMLIPAGNIWGIAAVGVIGYVLILIIMYLERKRGLISNRAGQQIVSEIRADLFHTCRRCRLTTMIRGRTVKFWSVLSTMSTQLRTSSRTA